MSWIQRHVTFIFNNPSGEFGQRSQPCIPKRYKRAEDFGVGILTPRGLFPRRSKNTRTAER